MTAKKFKITVAAFFILIFCVKMLISVAPVFLNFDDKVANAVIMQLEHESKTEKNDLEKDTLKDKKEFDEKYFHMVECITFVIENNILHNRENVLYKQLYHPVVPTPPPNA